MGLYELHNPGAPHQLRLGALELTAFAISGLASYVLVPGFDACFDLGHCAMEATGLRHVFLSHVHQDHAAGVPRHVAMRRFLGASPSRIFVPHESRDDLVAVLRAFERMERKPPMDLEAMVQGVSPGDEIALGRRRRVRVFDVQHRLASRGYTVLEAKRSLLPAYRGRDPREIAAARARGESVDQARETAAFTYVGDSTIETLRRHPELGQSEVLMLEATHLPGTDAATSRRYGHTHLDELIALYHQSPETLASPHILLKHFSTRYDRAQILAAAEALPDELRRRVRFLA